ncbi:MAG: hypothetical protein WCR67_04880 [Bacilli bacterium]
MENEETLTVFASEKEEISNPPYLYAVDDENNIYPFICNNDTIYQGKRSEFMFTGLLKSGKILFAVHDFEDRVVPGKYNKYYGFILEGEAANAIFHVSNPKKAVFEPKSSTYFMDEESSLSYVGLDKYSYTIYIKSKEGEDVGKSNMLTIYAERNDCIHYCDSLFSGWADYLDENEIASFLKDRKPQKAPAAQPVIKRPGLFDTLLKKW